MTPAKLLKAVDRELARRAAAQGRANAGAWSLEAFCGGHVEQLQFVKDRAPWIHVMCARQSGKSRGCLGMLLDNAISSPRSTNVFLGLTSEGVRTSQWFPAWKPLLDQYGIDRKDNETSMLSTFPNGARVLFGGTDDLTHVRTYLGNRLADSVFVLDEGQDQKDQVLRYILGTLLPPMLTPTSRVVVAGVLPDLEVGHFLELSNAAGWSKHEWGRAANVHTPEAMEQLRAYMALHNLTEDDPQIARDWFMRRVWLADAAAFRYARSVSGYDGKFPDWLDMFAVGVDPGTRDRTAVEVWGWGERDDNVYHVAEWVTERNSKVSWSDIGAELGKLQQRFKPHAWYYDAGGSKMTLDLFQRDYGIPLLRAAQKSDLPGQVARFADLLQQGRCKVIIGSALEADLQRAQWDKAAREKGLYRWSSICHPDAADAGRYGLQAYFENAKPVESAERMAYLASIRRAEEQARAGRVRNAGYDSSEFDGSGLDLFNDVG